MSHAENDIALAPAANWAPVKVVEVVDTRAYEEGPDDRWHPVPGSGTPNQCGRCGKDHEVHVTVEDEHGYLHVVGTSCANATGPLAKRIASVMAATKRLAALERQLAAAEEYWGKRSEIEAEMAPQFPGWNETVAPDLTGQPDPRRAVWMTKDGLSRVWVHRYPDEARPEWERPSDWERRLKDERDERERCLRDAWLREIVTRELGSPPNGPDIATLKNDIAKVEARMAALKDKAGKEIPSLEQMSARVVKRSGVDPRDKKAVYTEDDLAPHVGKTVTVTPKPGKTMHSTSRYYSAPLTGTLHSVWKDRTGAMVGFRLAIARGDGPPEIEEFSNSGHATLEVVDSIV